MSTITDYIAQHTEADDPDDTTVEVDLGLLRQWAAVEQDWAKAMETMDEDDEENEPYER